MSESRGTDESESGESADLNFPHANIVAVEALAMAVETAFGPYSRDKLIAEKREASETPARMPEEVDYIVTSDGATILEELNIEHPIGPIVERIIGPKRPGETDVVGQDIPDGVTGTVLFTTALLTEAKGLLEKGLHPLMVTKGYQIAEEITLEQLSELRRTGQGVEAQRDVALTAMTGNDIGQQMHSWAELAVQAVETVGPPNEASLVVRQFSDGTIDNSHLVMGSILDKNEIASQEMPKRIEDANVLLLGGQDDGGLRKTDIPEHYQITHNDGRSKERFARARQNRREEIVEQLKETGVDVVVVRQGIESEYYELLAEAGIAGIQAVSRLDMKHIALSTGAEPVLITEEFSSADLGSAGLVEERTVEPIARGRPARRIVVFDECENPKSVAVALHGVWENIADEAMRVVRKAAAAVSDAQGLGNARGGIVPGAGATDIEVSQTLRQEARSVGSREQLAVLAFADAVERVLAVFIRNSGSDHIDILTDLKSAHESGQSEAGFVCPEKEIRSAMDAGVLDPYSHHRQRYIRATQVARMLLRIDDTHDATFTTEPAGPDDVINPEAAERQMDALENRD